MEFYRSSGRLSNIDVVIDQEAAAMGIVVRKIGLPCSKKMDDEDWFPEDAFPEPRGTEPLLDPAMDETFHIFVEGYGVDLELDLALESAFDLV